MPGLDPLLDELERLLGEVEGLDEPVRDRVFRLLDSVDGLHRHALERLGALLSPDQREALRAGDPAVEWLFAAYSVGVDERAAAEAALGPLRPQLDSSGGEVTVVEARGGVVRVRLSGSCAGCTASTATLRQSIEDALRDGFPGFAAMEVEEGAPPAPTLLKIEPNGGP